MRVLRVGPIAACVLLSASLSAQDQSERVQFRSSVELLQLDVAVLDDKRQPVRGLTEKDFTVLDDGRPAPIRALTAVELSAAAPVSNAVWATEVAPDVITNQAGEQDGRLVIILMDRSIGIGEPTFTAKKIAAAAVDALGPHDLAAVVSTNNGAVQDQRVQNFTADRARLRRAIDAGDPSTAMSSEAKGLFARSGVPVDDLGDPRCPCGLCVLETITRVAEAVANTPRRRKLLMFIGTGIILQAARPISESSADIGCQTRLRDARTAMLAAIDRANLTVHAIDPQGLVNIGPAIGNRTPRNALDATQPSVTLLRNRESIALLPDRTGGRIVSGRNHPDGMVPAIFDESQAYYVIGIERGGSKRPDRTRELEIKMARKGLHVVAQRRYVALPSSPTSAPPTATTADAASVTAAALTGLLPSASVPLTFSATTFASNESSKAVVRVNLDAGAFARPDGTPVPLEIAIQAVDRVGRPVASATQKSSVTVPAATGRAVEVNVQSHLELEPGEYAIRAAVSDPATGRVASVFADVTVPKFDDDALSLSDINVETTNAPAARPASTTRRAFRRGEQVRAVLQIYQGTGRVDPLVPLSMRVRILDAKGTAVRDQTLPFTEEMFTRRRADCVITLPLSALAPGEYLLRLDASATNRRGVGRAVRFVVER